MAHNLSFTKGRAEMFYTGEQPWHGHGTKLDHVATAAEAITAAGLDWKVEKRQLSFNVGGQYQEMPGAFATIRADNLAPLGVVGSRYTPLTNRDAFRFFDAVVGEQLAMYHTAGALGAGEKVWILAKLPKTIEVVNGDAVEQFLLLCNSHDGSSAVEMLFTPIRVVCQNTLNVAMADTKTNKRFRARHTISVGMKVSEARRRLGIIVEQGKLFEQLSQQLTRVQMNQENFKLYLKKIGLITPDEDGELSTRAQNIMEEVCGLYEHGKGNDLQGVRGTAWGAFNAVAEYVDYRRGSEDKRAESLLFGSGATLKQAAWDEAVAIATR